MSKITCFTDEKTCPCVRSKPLRLYRHHAHMCFNMCAWCRYTRGRFQRTHGDVLSGQTEFRSVSHTNTHINTHNTHTTTQHNTTQHITTTTPHGERERQRQTETEKEDRDRQRREDGRRQDKTREERRFIFNVVVHGRFLSVW